LRVSNKENLNNALPKPSKPFAPDDIVPRVLRRVARERFPEWTLPKTFENAGSTAPIVKSSGAAGLRRGRLIWNLEADADRAELPPADPKLFDWEIVVTIAREGGSNVGRAACFLAARAAHAV
jgi:hypothetical protein